MTQKINKVNNISAKEELPMDVKKEIITYINANEPPTREPRETYLEIVAIIMKLVNAIRHAKGLTSKYTPKLVKTPFPPLNL
tara:strand:+ start:5384 stop:5629 length:246 start_codon:yes stop_codon:yes gene_type:complete